MKASLATAVALCRHIDAMIRCRGAFVGLTGGCLYNRGERKDIDLIIYRNREYAEINMVGVEADLEFIGLDKLKDHGFVKKYNWLGTSIDMLYPEEVGDTYKEGGVDK